MNLEKYSKISFLFCLIILLNLFVIFSFAAGAEAKLILKYAHTNNVYDATQLEAEVFKKLVEERTNNEIQIDIFPGTLTSSEEEAMEFMLSGLVDISSISAGHIAGFYPDVQFMQLPYLFNSFDHYIVARQSRPIRELIKGIEEESGLKVLGILSDTNGMAIASKKPIENIEDCKRVKLRCMQNPLFIDTYNAFGFVATPTDWGELYTSLQTGVVDANDLSVKANYDYKFNEVVKSFAITNQMWTQRFTFISPKTWDKLSQEQREIIEMSAKEASNLTDQYQYAKEKVFIEKAKADGFVVTYPDIEKFKDASQKVYDKWFKKYPQWKSWYEDIQYLDPYERETKAATAQ